MCALTAGFCGYFMSRHAAALARGHDPNGNTMPESAFVTDLPKSNTSLKHKGRLFLCLLAAYSVVLLAASPFLQTVFLNEKQARLLFPFSYAIALPVIIAAQYLTLHFLKRGERNPGIWIAGFAGLGLLPGLVSALTSYPHTLHPMFFNFNLYLSGFGAVLAALSGFLMWLMMTRGFFGREEAAKPEKEIKTEVLP